MEASGIVVLRPVLFILTDGVPTDDKGVPADDQVWLGALERLTDAGWKDRPHIIVYGFGAAQQRVLARIATAAAFVAEEGADNKESLAKALTSMLGSLVASARARALQIPEEVPGYRSLPLERARS